MKKNSLYNKKYFYLIIAFFVVWIFVSSYWYICGIKGFCRQYDNARISEKQINKTPNHYKIENTSSVVKKEVTCTLYLKKNVLSKYSNRDDIAKVQKFLNDYFGDSLVVNGLYNQKTKNLIENFQIQNNLEGKQGVVLGKVGEKTRYEINKIFCTKKAKDFLEKQV